MSVRYFGQTHCFDCNRERKCYETKYGDVLCRDCLYETMRYVDVGEV